MNKALVLRNGLAAGKQRRHVLGDGGAHVALGVFDGSTVAEARGKRRTPGIVALILGLLFDDDLEAVKLRSSAATRAGDKQDGE